MQDFKICKIDQVAWRIEFDGSLSGCEKYIPDECEVLFLNSAPSCNILGVLLKPNLKIVALGENAKNSFASKPFGESKRISESYTRLFNILHKHLSLKDRDILQCQEDLIEAGFEEFANL